MSNKVALVTGGASGLGKAIARRLASDGAQVVITDIQASLGQEVASEFGFTFMEHDVTNETQWRRVIDDVEKRHGVLNVLVNNAGILSSQASASPQDWLLTEWQKIFAVNVEGVFLGCRSVIPLMTASGGGSIINISSIAGIIATPFALAYGASKATVRHLTKSIAQHCAEEKSNIRCNSVHPGMVRTPPWDKGQERKAKAQGVPVDVILKKMAAVVPMGDLTLPEDIASAVAFLASDESRHMTGGQLIIDGGMVHCDSYHSDLTGRR